MPCPDCENSATPEQIADLLDSHHQRITAIYEQRLDEVLASLEKQVAELAGKTATRPANETLH
ncbi:MAG: hypothetical protein ACQEW0_09105 [Pseudomonadota bacterium]